jgi:hypothetical protein
VKAELAADGDGYGASTHFNVTVTPSVLTGAELAVFHIEYHHEACPFIAESIPH